MNLYVLLKHYNEYDQPENGEFIGIYTSKEQAEKSVNHIGRQNLEHSWYEIEEIKLNTNLNNKNLLVCDDCGKNDDTVKKTYCPYTEEIHNKKVLVTICDNCYHESCENI